jgi:hypothetical protein
VLRRLVDSADKFPADTPALASSCAGATISFTRSFVGYVTAADFAVHAGANARSEPSTMVQLILGFAGIALFLKLRRS